MQLKSWGRPSNAAGGFFMGLIHLMDWGFELQIVPPDMSFTALKRGDHEMSITKFTLVTKPEQLRQMEAGPFSIIMGANLRELPKPISSKKQSKVKKENDNG